MLSLLVPAMLLALVDPSPTPLREIGSVRATVCTTIVVHANGAIADALANDQDLAILANRLRTTDIETSNEIERNHRMNDLMTLAQRIRTASSAGDAEVKRLRALADESTNPERKAELKKFADALGGALYRQKKEAVDLDKLVAVIEGRRASAEARATVSDANTGFGTAINQPGATTANYPSTPVSQPTESPGWNRMLRDAADDFATRLPLILSDEGVAADHSVGATTGC
jgi:hypothetical protein